MPEGVDGYNLVVAGEESLLEVLSGREVCTILFSYAHCKIYFFNSGTRDLRGFIVRLTAEETSCKLMLLNESNLLHGKVGIHFQFTLYLYTSEKPVRDQSYGVLDRYGVTILYK